MSSLKGGMLLAKGWALEHSHAGGVWRTKGLPTWQEDRIQGKVVRLQKTWEERVLMRKAQPIGLNIVDNIEYCPLDSAKLISLTRRQSRLVSVCDWVRRADWSEATESCYDWMIVFYGREERERREKKQRQEKDLQ